MTKRLNAEQLAKLAEELAHDRYSGLGAQQGYALLHATTATETVTELQPMSLGEMLTELSVESAAKLPDASMVEFSRAVVGPNKDGNGDREAVGMFLGLWLKAGKIEQTEYNACAAQLTRTHEVTRTVAVLPRIYLGFGGVDGMPGAVHYDDFATAWQAAGRN